VLTYMHDAVAKRGIAGGSVGYYVGGMKEKDLKATESKKVVMATYAMAQEALDIKTLTTLIMATPKTDIEQAVGRILRQRHAHMNPIVVDIVDTHEPLKVQWKKRVAFYKKQNYKVVYTTFPKYRADRVGCWETIYKPKSEGISEAISEAISGTKCSVQGSVCKEEASDEDSDIITGSCSKDTWTQGKCLLKLPSRGNK